MQQKGLQKAALLLTTLDNQTAMELLKGQSQDVIHKIAMELSQLDARGNPQTEQAVSVTRQFCSELEKRNSGALHIKSFVGTLLHNSSGKEKPAELQARLEKAVREKDPFIAIASTHPAQITAAIENDPPQALALVLAHLSPKLATEVLARLEPNKSLQIVWRMTHPQEVSPKTLNRIGEIISKRIRDMNSEDRAPVRKSASQETLRKVAIVLSGLEKEKRDHILEQIQGKDQQTATMVKALMLTWDDIPKIENKSLQEILRKVESDVLAKALHTADPAVNGKIRSNISERAAEMVDEEASLLGEPRKKDILAAREDIAKMLREANEAGQLLFIEEE